MEGSPRSVDTKHGAGTVREEDQENHQPMTPHSWAELQRRFDQVDHHVRESATKLDRLTERVHGLETQIAGGPQFPLWAKGMVATILLQTGAAFWWAGAIDERVNQVPDLSARLTSAFTAMRNSDVTVKQMEDEHIRMQSAVDALVKKALENQERSITCCGEMKVMSERVTALTSRLDVQERRSMERDKWWQTIWSSGVLKGLKP